MSPVSGWDQLSRIEFPDFSLQRSDLQKIAYLAIRLIKEEIRAGKNVTGGPAKQYSNYGPIYIPIYGVGTGTFGRGAGKQQARRTASRTGFGFTRAHAQSTPYGSTTPSGKSMKFKNREEYKKALGKPGWRDLEVTGQMLGAIGITLLSNSQVNIGFTRETEEKKMRGNIAIDNQWGFSPRVQQRLTDYANLLVQMRIRQIRFQ